MIANPCRRAFCGLLILAALCAPAAHADGVQNLLGVPGVPTEDITAPVESEPSQGLPSAAISAQPRTNLLVPANVQQPPIEAEPPVVPSQMADEAQQLLALQQMVDSAQIKVSADIQPPPSKLTVRPGKNEILTIARGHINRIVTPFEAPDVKTASSADISSDLNVIYVISYEETPITLYIMESGAPEQAMSLTLLPRGIPPVEVTLTLEGTETTRPASMRKAAEWEMSQPYVVTMKNVFRTLAVGQVPDGYGLSNIQAGVRGMPYCEMAGFDVHPEQRLEGAHLTVYVYRAVNATIDPVEVDESACAADGVLGIAAWPESLVEPGYETELYIAVANSQDNGTEAQRPSVLRFQ